MSDRRPNPDDLDEAARRRAQGRVEQPQRQHELGVAASPDPRQRPAPWVRQPDSRQFDSRRRSARRRPISGASLDAAQGPFEDLIFYLMVGLSWIGSIFAVSGTSTTPLGVQDIVVAIVGGIGLQALLTWLQLIYNVRRQRNRTPIRVVIYLVATFAWTGLTMAGYDQWLIPFGVSMLDNFPSLTDTVSDAMPAVTWAVSLAWGIYFILALANEVLPERHFVGDD